MTLIETPREVSLPDLSELVLQKFDPKLIVISPDNPAPNPAVLADLEPSMLRDGQRIPGLVCPSPELAADQRLCLEGAARRAVCLKYDLPFWAFDLGRFVSEEERIRLHFSCNYIRRRMTREEVAEKAARYIELTGATQAEAAKHLNVTEPTLSRAFGEQKILPHLRERVSLLGYNVRTLIASTPPELMERAVEYAATPRDDKLPTHNQVAAWVAQQKKASPGKGRKAAKPKTITLKLNGRAVTFSVVEKDTAFSVTEDLKAVVARLGKKELADVAPDGWPFLFQ